MKRMTTILLLSTGLVATPVVADDNRGLLTKENVGGAIGATVGGLLGSQIGHGDGRVAATAVGAVGGFILGRDVGHNYRGGQKYKGGYRDGQRYGSRRGHGYQDSRDYQRGLQRIDKTFRAKTTSNVRAGPGTRFHVVDQLRYRERVHVVGKVQGRNWFMVQTGHRQGFVYAPLLRPDRHGYRGNRGHDRWNDRGNRRGGWYR